jgi:predicted GIY-YIG superfamily endonuclease
MKSFFYVYILVRQKNPMMHYTGVTRDLIRLKEIAAGH